ncbi:MAG: phage tail length tape measure family protein [Burkholderiales bacterium]|nr:phage tail length tape measure family protein [Burkholderiales bacterium]
MSDLKLQGEVSLSTEKVEAAFDRVGDKAEQMSSTVGRAAATAGKSVDNIGAGAEQNAERFTRAESRMRDAIRRSTQELQLLGKTASEKLEFNIAAKGLDASKFAPYIAELKQVEAAQRAATGSLDKMGVSAAQTAAALRGVPAQFTDIVTSLQGGQQPLTVLLQQGGQLKDMFGGAGAAARALGGYIAGLITPFTLTAAAVAGVAVAYAKGSAEADGYRKALVTTGNAAGLTASQMQQMAARISTVVGTQSGAADVLARMAASTRISAREMDYFGEVALKVEKTIGTSVADTVKQFSELGKAPVESSRKLNEEANYLTASIYEQIKALKEQGRESDAAALAQKTYADALNGRTAQITQNLGTLERAWQGITGAAKGAWDSMLNVGRESSLSDRIAEVRNKINQANGNDPNRRFSVPFFDTPKAELEQQLAYLTEEDRMLRRGAEAQAQRVQAENAAITAADALQKAQDKGLTKQQQMNKALEEYRQQLADLRATNPSSALLSTEAVARGEQWIRDQFKESGSNVGQGEVASIRARTIEMQRYLELLRTHGSEAEKMTDGEKLVIKIQEELKTSISGVARAEKEKALVAAQALAVVDREVASESARQKAIKDTEAAMGRQIDAMRGQADSIRDHAAAQEAVNANLGKTKTAVEQATLAQIKLQLAEADSSDRFAPAYVAALAAKAEAQQRYVKALQDAEYLQRSVKQTEASRLAAEESDTLDLQLSLLGQSQQEREKIIAQRQIEVRLAKELAEIEKLNLGEGVEADEKRATLRAQAQANAIVEANNAAKKSVVDEWQRTSDQISQSLTDALMRGFESGKDFAKNLRDTVVNMFKTMVLRPVISAIINPVAAALSGALGFAGTAAAAQGGAGNGVSTALGGASMLGNSAFAMGLNGAWGAGGGLLSTLNAGASLLGSGSIMQGLGVLAGALGPIAIGFSLLSSLIKKSTPHMGAGVTYSAEHGLTAGASQYNRGNYGFGAASEYSSAAESTVSAVARGIATALDSTARTFGRQAGFEISTAFADDASKDGAWGQFAIRRNGQTILDWRDGQTDRWAPRVFSDGEAGVQEYQRAVAQSMREALDKMDLPGWASDMLDALGDSPSIENLGNTLDQINAAQTAFEQLGQGISAFSNISSEALDALVKAAGGPQALIASANAYYQAFYSDAERAAAVTRQVASSMEALGLSMPSSREQFRALVEAQDLTTESGRATYYALLQLSPAFASVTSAVEDTATALAQQRTDAYSALEHAVSAQKRVLQSQLQAAQDVVNTLSGLFRVLHDNVRDLYGSVESASAQQSGQASQYIAAALATARASGYLPDADQIAEAISAARAGLDVSNYGGSSAERDYAALVLAGQLSGLEEVAGKQLTDAQRTVQELERQTEQLDQTLEYWRQQIDIASGTYTGVLSVATAVDRLSAILSGNSASTGPASSSGGGGEIIGPAYRDRGTVARVDYGADVALSSFDKFKAWYQGYATNANTAAMQSSGYKVPDWMRVSHAPSNDDEMFGTYLFFRNNPQYAADFEQVMTTGRSSMPTDGSTLVRSDLSKMPADAAEFFAHDRNSLLSYEAFGLDPVLAYRLYKDGPGQFGLDGKRENFTEWLRTHKWTEGGIVETDNTLTYANAQYQGYKLPRWDTSTGNIVDLDGRIYSPDGRFLGTASRDMMSNIYGSAFVDSLGGNYGSTTHSALYNSHVTDSQSEAAFYAGIKDKFDAAIAGGQSAQDLADEIARSGVSMSDVAAAYGISVAVLEENLRNGGATNIPKFAVGTNYVPRDMLAYIHEGEAVVPKAYNPALNNFGAGDTGRLEALIEKLTAEVAELKAAANATADNTGKSAGVLVAVQRGNSLSQVAEPTF